jgi:RimJ/RimL family protein N-acetyltransferase
MSLDFSVGYILENEKVLLRPLVSGDVEHLLTYALNEPTLWRFSLVSAAGEDGMKAYIDTALQAKKQQQEYPFIVFDKTTGKYAGCTRFYDIQLAFKTLQLGYTWYGSAFHGTGLNKNCKYLLLSLAFDQLGFERVEFRADNDNARSIAAMKSIGCKVDGILRSNMPKAISGRRDSIVLSILKHEWNDGVKEALAARIGERLQQGLAS